MWRSLKLRVPPKSYNPWFWGPRPQETPMYQQQTGNYMIILLWLNFEKRHKETA